MANKKEIIEALNWAYEQFNLGFMRNRVNPITFGEENYDVFMKHLDTLKPVEKDLFGEKVKNVMFKGVTAKEDNGFMMCACGQSAIDNQHYVVTTNHLHIDEIPNECNDASNFSELVANLLNEHFNK